MIIRTVADLATLIRNTRLTLGETQVGVARRAGISRDSLIRIEQGHPRVELANVLAVLQALDVTLSSADDSSSPSATGDSVALLDAVFDALHHEDQP